MRNIDIIREVTSAAAGKWPYVLAGLSIDVPDSSRRHAPCPACGGKDRFRFDDNGRGSFICNQCGAGDGLDLIKRVNNCDTTEAAQLAADVLGIDYRAAESAPDAASQRQRQLAADRQQREQERQKQAAEDAEQRRATFARLYTGMRLRSIQGESEYLKSKGLTGFKYPLMPDGSLLLELVDESGAVAAAQTITPHGEKRLLTGSAKRGAYHAVNAPESPQSVLIAEGLATALSVHLMRPDALAVAAIDAGNLLPVAEVMRRKHPKAQIIIAADNDHHQNGEANTGREAAGKAALSVAGWVSMPPTDYKTDWNDYHQQNGLEAATAAFNDSMYQPQGESVKPQLQAIEGGKSGQPEKDPLKPHVESRADGVFWVTPKVDKDSGEVINQEAWLCSPLEVVGTGRDDKDQYLIIRWQAFGVSALTTAAIPLADIGEREGWRTLKAGGINVTTKSSLRAILADWLQRSGARELWRVAHATGWQCGAYIMPDGEVIGTPEHPVLFNGRSSAAAGYTVKGTAEDWRGSVAHLVAGNYSMMTATAAALAAPLIGLAGADGFGIHFYEQSSAGKTTTANVASSLYGNPDLLRLTWYGTALGLANEAAAHNDGLMPLDEVGQGSDPVSVSQSAYALFNGVGKLQGAKEGGNRDLKRWRTVAISTGEMDLETFIAGAGRRTKAGQLVRLLNIPLSKAVRFHEHRNGKQHADALKEAYQHHHGAAGRLWIKWLADHQQQATEAVRECEARWRSLIPADYGEQVHRVAARFAILEAALLLSAGITGWDAQTCRDAVQHSYNAWLREFGTGNKEHQQIIEQTEAFLNAYGLSRFAPFPYSPADLPIKELAGYRRRQGEHDESPISFYTFPATFEKEIAAGFNHKQFAEVLKRAGMLTPPSSGRGYQRKSPRIQGRQINVYVLNYLPEDYNQPEE
ncbi:DNA primase [Klebsiella pneumoniae]|nr:DNA primase [Klebsiella pneumoniae]VAQ30987.1 DNA primase [Klebsiella pneumoniae]